jgi:prepilin-type processing-associated H-X9-DG protein
MKKAILLLVVSFSFLACEAQNWDSVSGGVGGYWNFESTAVYGQVNALLATDSLLYIGGWFDTINRVKVGNHINQAVCSFDGTRLCAYGTSNLMGQTPIANALLEDNGQLYFGGLFTASWGTTYNLKSQNCVAWDGAYTYDSLAGGLSFEVHAMCKFNNMIYAGGSRPLYTNSSKANFAFWDGSSWNTMNNPIKAPFLPNRMGVNALTVYNGMLIVAGWFDSAGGLPVSNIAAYDGTNWYSLGSGVNKGV